MMLQREQARADRIPVRASHAAGSLTTLLANRDLWRGQAMLVVLALIWIGFDILTQGLFLSPRNLSALAIQGAIKGVLAVGMTLLLIAGELDLSVGATVALAGIVSAELQVFGFSTIQTVVLTIVCGVVLGAIQGSLVAFAAIPAFIVTLAGMLAWRGLGFVITHSASIAPVSDSFSAIVGSYLPTGLSAVILAAAALYAAFWAARAKSFVKGGFAIAAIGVVAWVVLSYRGLPTAVLIMACCALVGVFLLRQTVFGRRVYVVGGNPEAALYAGISRRQLRFVLFLIMGLVYGLAGAMMTARLGGAPPNVGVGLELDVISACIIGGVSLFGGRGEIQGAIVGVFLFESLTNGMALLNLNVNFQLVVRGLVLVGAVWLDVISQKRGAART
jgi:D-xylose transport system permease protein